MHKLNSLGLCAVLLVIVGCSSKPDEEPDALPGGIHTQFISESAFAAIVVHPQRVFDSKTLRPVDLGFLMEQMNEEMGFDLRDVEQVIVAFSIGARGEPEPSTVFRLKSAYNQDTLRKKSAEHFDEEVKHNGKSYFTFDPTYESANCVAYPDNRTILMSESQTGMKQMLSGGGPGRLVTALTGADPSHDAIAVVTLTPIRATLVELAREETFTEGFANVPNQIDTIVATADLDPKPRAEVVISASSPKDAESLKDTVDGVRVLAKGTLGELRREVSQEMDDEFADKLVSALTTLLDESKPQVSGNRVTISVTAPDNVDEFVKKLGEIVEVERRRVEDRKPAALKASKELGKGGFKGDFKGETTHDFDDGFKDK